MIAEDLMKGITTSILLKGLWKGQPIIINLPEAILTLVLLVFMDPILLIALVMEEWFVLTIKNNI